MTPSKYRVALGSSTGGVSVIEHILLSLPSRIPPVLIVQHIPASFSKALADRLNSMCDFTVKEAQNDEEVKENTVYIAPGGRHMEIKERKDKEYIQISDGEPVNHFKPSVDKLFMSIAKTSCKNTIGVILTGMGNDGAKGLLSLKNAGAYTISQDKTSSAVFGMPKEAIRLGAAKEICPFPEIASSIVKVANSKKVSKAS